VKSSRDEIGAGITASPAIVFQRRQDGTEGVRGGPARRRPADDPAAANRRIDLDRVIRLPGDVPVAAMSLIDRSVSIVAVAGCPDGLSCFSVMGCFQQRCENIL